MLRPGAGNTVNFRASYVQETQKVIIVALKKIGGQDKIVSLLEKVKGIGGENPKRNQIISVHW